MNQYKTPPGKVLGHGISGNLPGKKNSLERHTRKLLRKVCSWHWSNGIKQAATGPEDTHQPRNLIGELSERLEFSFLVMGLFLFHMGFFYEAAPDPFKL